MRDSLSERNRRIGLWAVALVSLVCLSGAYRGQIERTATSTALRVKAGGGALLRIAASAIGTSLPAERGSAPAITRATVGTYVDGNGVIQTASAGQFRVESSGVLVEPLRAFPLLQSEDLSASPSPWANTDIGVTPNQGPANWTDLDLITTANTSGALQQTLTVTSSTGPWTVSAYAASQSSTANFSTGFFCPAGNNAATCTCVRSDGGTCTVGMSTIRCSAWTAAGTTPVRLAVTGTCTSAATTINAYFMPGVRGASTSTVLAGRAQFEAGPCATSYYATAGTAGQRNADVVTGVNPFTSESSWYVQVTAKTLAGWGASGGGDGLWGIGTATAANSARGFVIGAAVYFYVYDAAGASKYVTYNHGYVSASSHTITFCNASGTLKIYSDGSLVSGASTGAGTGNIGTMPSGDGSLTLGAYSATSQLGGNIKDIRMGRGCPL